MSDLDICYLPAQWRTLKPEHLRASACVVIDVIRATSTIAMALAEGAQGIQPVADSADAFALKALNPEMLLAGERGGKPLAGFDLGNSPQEYTRERIQNQSILLTTTNGTQALAACREARAVITASLLNLDAVATRLKELGPPWIIACAGFEGSFGMDDTIVAGALAEALECEHTFAALYRSVRKDLPAVLLGSQAGQELVKVGLEKDIAFCAQLNLLPIVPTLDTDGMLRAL